jgi:mono/diheme cytochrome c family protein
VADGKVVWQKMNCAECHSDTGKPVAGKATVDLSNASYMAKQKPINQYVLITYGKDGTNHPALKDQLSRRELWDLVFYTRTLATPALTDKDIELIDPVFGSNCAVCHGKRGHGDGPLARNLDPIPANFHQYSRFYDREDDVLYDHIANGIKWEGMPNFLNKQDRVKNVKFDEAYIRKLVQYVRHFGVETAPTLAQAQAPAQAPAETAKTDTTAQSNKEETSSRPAKRHRRRAK